jgi:sugar phosphate isomerase/epimerase
LPARIAKKGLSCVHLALQKSFPGFDMTPGKLSPGIAHYIRDAFHKHNLNIAVLGCYINLIHPDPEERKKLLTLFKEYLAFVRDFGCSVVASETGSANPDFSTGYAATDSEADWQSLVQSVGELVEVAEKHGVFVGIEGAHSHVINTPQRIRDLLDTIDSPNLRVVYDPKNLITIDNYQNQDKVIKEAFALLADRMVSVHAKDFAVDEARQEIIPVPPGKGLMNYNLIFSLLKKHKHHIYVTMESVTEDIMDEAIAFLRNAYQKANADV